MTTYDHRKIKKMIEKAVDYERIKTAIDSGKCGYITVQRIIPFPKDKYLLEGIVEKAGIALPIKVGYQESRQDEVIDFDVQKISINRQWVDSAIPGDHVGLLVEGVDIIPLMLGKKIYWAISECRIGLEELFESANDGGMLCMSEDNGSIVLYSNT